MVGPPSSRYTGDSVPSQANQTVQVWWEGSITSTLPAVCTPSSPAWAPTPAQGPGMDRAQVREVGGNKWAFFFFLLLFFNLQFCASCQYTAT